MSTAVAFPLVRLSAARLRRRIFGLPVAATTFRRRGFASAPPATQAWLEHVGALVLLGYHAALAAPGAHELADALQGVPLDERGFAYEGAAMGLALLARLFPWRRRALREFLDGPAQPHVYMAHIGIGWAWAALPGPIAGSLQRHDGIRRYLIMDGFGFYHGYFHARRYLRAATPPSRVRGYARRVFDQGMGRALWFVAGADPERVETSIEALPAERRGDLWAGVGLAAAYACGVDAATLEALAERAGACRPQLAQGACFAALTRHTAANPAPHGARASLALCGRGPEEAAQIASQALHDARGADDGERYEDCRRRIQSRFLRQGG